MPPLPVGTLFQQYVELSMKRLLSLLLVLIISGCGTQPVGTISVEMLQDMKDSGATLVDIRTPQQWEETGVILGSHLLTVFDANNRFAPDSFRKIEALAGGKDKPVVLLSQTGRRSALALKIMTEQLGFTEVYHAASGISGWQMYKKPMVKPADNEPANS